MRWYSEAARVLVYATASSLTLAAPMAMKS